MTQRSVAAMVRFLDLLLPGAGTLWAGRRNEGWNAILAWAFLPSILAAAVVLLDLDPRRAILALAILYAAMQCLLWLTPTGPIEAPRAARPFAGALVFIVLVILAGLSLSRSVTIVTVPDHGNWPGLLPGESIVVRRADFLASPPERGDLVAARAEDGIVLARVVGKAGDLVEVSGPTLRVNGAEVSSEELGDLRLEGPDGASPEAKGLRAWREHFEDRNHLVFFARGVSVAPIRSDVPEGRVFLLSDNRSTASAADSRLLGTVALADLVGRPHRVLWSPGPEALPRWDRIGARWP